MSNSSLVNITVKSPNHSGTRTHSVDRITPHCVVGQLIASSIGGCFTSSKSQASCNYGIGSDGLVCLVVDEDNRSWCSSNKDNDQRAVTIECASDKTDPYAFTDVVYNKLIELCVDICKRHGKTKLLWLGDKDKTLSYEPVSDEMVLTVHRWFANKACPGDWMYARMGDLAERVTAQLGGNNDNDVVSAKGTQASSFSEFSEEDVIKTVGALFTADQKKSGILASVSLAQFILESGYGKSELAQNANNCFGMKKSLSGNTWSGSTWDGTSIYTKKTQEQNADGSYETITADFRKYTCVEDSIADHSAYLLGAKNGSNLRYPNIAGMTDYKSVAQLIKDGGYATSLTYVDKLCSIIEKWNLTQYDVTTASETNSTIPVEDTPSVSNLPAVPFTVKVIIDDLNYRSEGSMNGKVLGQTGKGIFTIVEVNSDGWGKLKSGAGWVYLMNSSYCTIGSAVTAETTSTDSFVAYTVKVTTALNIRKGPGTNYETNGVIRDNGIYTIVAESDGTGASKWGKLKSGAGWISLDFCSKQ